MSRVQHDRTVSDAPWRDPIPRYAKAWIPADAVYEGEFAYWIDGVPPDFRILCAGPKGIMEVHNAEYPDAVYDREQRMLRQYRERTG